MVANSQTVLLLLSMKVQSQLDEVEVAHHLVVEAPCGRLGPLEPARDGVAGMARDPGCR